MHHNISDGSSAAVLVKEFNDLYARKSLPEITIQYKDYVAWYKKLMSSYIVKKQRKYWLEQMEGEIPVLNFPTDYSRPPAFDFRGAAVKNQIDKTLADKLYKLARENRVTLYTVLLTAYYILLYKYTGQNDVIIGTPNAGRRHEDVYNTVGMFVSTLALRNNHEPGKTLKDFMVEVGASVVKAFDNQDYPFEDLVESIILQRDPGRNPIFDFMFVLQNIYVDDVKVEDSKCSLYEFERGIIQYDITLSATENKAGILLVMHYCTALFKRETVEKIARHYINILKAITLNPHTILAHIDMLDEEEKTQLLYTFNDTAADYSKEKTIQQLFEEQVSRTPENIAVLYKEKQLTYRELDVMANQIAHYLIEEHGIKAELFIGVLMESSEQLIVAALGILKAGGAYIPIDPEYPFERIKTIIDDAGLGVVISSKKHIKILNKLQWECKSFNGYLCMDSDNVYAEEEEEKSELMDRTVWEYVGQNATDDIEAGAWVSSYTGEDLTKEEMDEYGENVLSKLKPYLDKNVRVLEIGCASGLSMYRIAPYVGLYYGTDLSEVIINKNKQRVAVEGIKNIKLLRMAAHEIDSIGESGFDIVIINSVVQCFHGHNYLRGVISKAFELMKEKGILFIGDIMNEDLKADLIKSLVEFKRNNSDCSYRTKTDWSVELFLSKASFEDLKVDMSEISSVEFSDKIYTIENELTKFRYDVIVSIDKTNKTSNVATKKHKVQHDINTLRKYDGTSIISFMSSHNNAAYVIYTSGTTGKPKGVLIEHRNVVRLMFNSRMKFDFCDKDVWTMFHSFSFDFSVWEMYGALLYGGKLIVIARDIAKDTNEYIKILKNERVTVLNQTPSAFYNLINAEMAFEDKSLDLRYVIFGGEALKPETLKGWRSKYPEVKLVNMYGITETTVHVTYKEITGHEIQLNLSNIGKPIPTLTTYVMDANMQLLPVGVSGELCVGGEGVSRGYLKSPELTEKKFVDNPYKPGERLYKSGDLVKMMPDGDMEYLGRIDHQVKIRGHRIELGEIEAAIIRNDSIKEAVVIAREDENGEKSICVYYMSEKELTVSEFKEYLSHQLPHYAMPSYYIKVEKIPLTKNGKVDKKQLPNPLDNINTGMKYEAPTNELEEKLVEEWKRLLGVESVGINDNFFELGGHSLKATIFVARAHQLFNVEIPLVEIFRTPTVKELAQYIKNAEENISKSIKPVQEAEYYPLSSAQKRLFLIKMLEGESITYNMSGAMMIEGELDFKKFEETYRLLIKRHESFRTTFVLENGEPVQQIHKEIEFAIKYLECSQKEVESEIRKFIRAFDLGKAPLMRACLIKLSPCKHILVSDMHHIISDGVSLEILTRDFISLYNGKSLPELRIQYKDFTVWQNDFMQSDAIKNQKNYWLDVFSKESPVLNMPSDFTRPSIHNFEGESIHFEIGRELVQALSDLTKRSGATMYMLLLAAYNILLHKYTGQDDIVVGSPVAGRRHADLENIIGMFVNTLAMRNYPQNDKTFMQFLEEVKDNCLKAFENQDYQFEELVDNLEIRRDLSRNPLFDTMFVLQNMNTAKISIKDIDFKPYMFDNMISKFDLTLNAVEQSQQISVILEYCTKLFKRETMEKFAEHFKNILKEVVNNPEIKLHEINMMSEKEINQILQDFNNTAVEYPKDKTIHELFEEQVERTSDNVAVVFEDKKLTYDELNKKANQLAHLLREKGIKPDDIVGIMVERSLEMIIGILGILKTRGVYLPIDPLYPEERIQYMLEDSKARILLLQNKLTGRVKFDGEIINLNDERLYEGEDSNPELKNTSRNLAYVIYTSGSTGKPKGVMIENRSIVNTLCWRKVYYGFNEEEVVLQIPSISFDSSVEDIFTFLLVGAKLVLIDQERRNDIIYLEKVIKENKVTHFLAVPSLYKTFLEEIPDSLNGVRSITLAGESFSQKLVEEHFRKLGDTRLYNEYGPTENSVCTTVYEFEKENPKVLIGKPISNCKCYILDERNNLQPLEVSGELCVCGSGLARGYLNREDLTKDKFVQNPFIPGEKMYKSGDLARWLPDGNIEYLGRIDHQVKIRGFRIEPGEIVHAILKHSEIKDAVVLDKNDVNDNKYLCAYIASDKEFDVGELREYLLNELPEYMIPARFFKIDKVPLTPNGKVDINYLKQINDSISIGGIYKAPSNEIEEKLVDIWSEILNLEKEKIGINTNFFELGGNSILLMGVCSQLEKEYPGKVKITDLFSFTTIKRLADFIKKEEKIHSYTTFTIPTLKLPQDYISVDSKIPEQSIFSFRLQDMALKNVKDICKMEGFELCDLFVSIYAYVLSETTGREEIAIQTIINNINEANILLINFTDANDFLDITKSVCQKRQNVNENTSYAIERINTIDIKKEEYSVAPLFYISKLVTEKVVLLDIYDIIISMDENNQFVDLKLYYNSKMLKNERMRELIDKYAKLLNVFINKYKPVNINK